MTQKKRLVRFYKGKPVKRMRQGQRGIILTMLGKDKGVAGTQLTITQAEWDQYGSLEAMDKLSNDELRSLID